MTALRYTLATAAQLDQEIRKSRFTAHALSVPSEEAALEFLQRVADPAATHNCWAWRIGQRYRFNDDGEPGGTAGKPILQAIDGQGLDQVIVVVTRWFGGIKLGAGGLMRAYGGCAAECLRQAEKLELVQIQRIEFALEFAQLALLRARLRAFDAGIEAEDFSGTGVTLRVALPVQHLDALRRVLADLSRGRAALRLLD